MIDGPKSVECFFNTISIKDKKRIKKESAIFSIGPVTTKALRKRGIKKIFSPKQHTINGLVDACEIVHGR